MALKLMMDGKELGSIEGDQIKTPDGSQVHVTDNSNADTMTVPLDHPVLHRADVRSQVHTPDGTPAPAPTDDGTPVIDPVALETKLLKQQVEALTNQLRSVAPQNVKTNQQGDTEIEIEDLINVKEEDDPHGIARTLKQVVKGLKGINERVNRVDNFFNYQEFQKVIDRAKGDYDSYFKDPKIGPLAERMLETALRTDATNPVPVIVANVIKDVQSAGLNPQDGKVNQDVKNKKQIPPTVRSSDGVAPSITVTRPKNLRESKEHYAAWRAARDKAASKGIK